MNCRAGCAACCIAISISSPLPGMPLGKPAGVRCVNLDDQNNCLIHMQDNYPEVCRQFTAQKEYCGNTRSEAMNILGEIENKTSAS